MVADHFVDHEADELLAELGVEISEKFIRFVIDEVIRHHQQHAAGK